MATHSSILFFFFPPLQYSCLENLMDRGAYCPRSGKESEMTKAT